MSVCGKDPDDIMAELIRYRNAYSVLEDRLKNKTDECQSFIEHFNAARAVAYDMAFHSQPFQTHQTMNIDQAIIIKRQQLYPPRETSHE